MIRYLEIVTDDVDATVSAYESSLSQCFKGPIAELGNAKVMELSTGVLIGVRRPMHDSENPVVRPYTLVNDIDATIYNVEQAGATVAVPVMEIPGYGKVAIYFLGENQFGLWQDN